MFYRCSNKKKNFNLITLSWLFVSIKVNNTAHETNNNTTSVYTCVDDSSQFQRDPYVISLSIDHITATNFHSFYDCIFYLIDKNWNADEIAYEQIHLKQNHHIWSGSGVAVFYLLFCQFCMRQMISRRNKKLTTAWIIW